jgi:hypothetical protein
MNISTASPKRALGGKILNFFRVTLPECGNNHPTYENAIIAFVLPCLSLRIVRLESEPEVPSCGPGCLESVTIWSSGTRIGEYSSAISVCKMVLLILSLGDLNR